jgi:hypothetical protein
MEQWKLFVEILVVCGITGNTEQFGVAAGLSVCSLEVRGLILTSCIGCLRFLRLSSIPLIPSSQIISISPFISNPVIRHYIEGGTESTKNSQ